MELRVWQPRFGLHCHVEDAGRSCHCERLWRRGLVGRSEDDTVSGSIVCLKVRCVLESVLWRLKIAGEKDRKYS